MQLTQKKAYTYYAVAIALFLAIKLFVPITSGLTVSGVNTMATFAAVIFLWIFVGTVWPSLLGFACLVMFCGADFTTLAANSFGHWGVPFMFSAMLLNAALLEAGVIQTVANWFISRKICKGRPWIFVLMFLGSAFLLGLVLDCLPVIMVYLALIDSICKELGYEKGNAFGKMLTMGIAVCVITAYAATPISHGIAIMMMAWLDSVGHPISFLQYISVGIPYGVLFFALQMLLFRFLCKPDFTKFEAYDPEARKSAVQKFDKNAKINVTAFVAVVIMWLLPDAFAPIMPSVATYFRTISSTVPPMIGCTALALLYVDGKPCFDVNEGLKKVSIPTLVFVVGIQAFVYAMGAEYTGISTWLANIFAPSLSKLPPTAFVFMILLVVVITTQFLSNMVVQSMFFFTFVPGIIAMNAGGEIIINPVAFGVLISIAACISFMMPSSFIGAPLCYSTGYLNVGDGVKLGWPIAAAGWLLLILVIWPLACNIF